ncbi:putative amidohydrolase [Mesotoga prima MesG1.Ag.4.2]|uniref:Putative amidohydrolase n=1 Tax=Mesotoga prima MesG1.Ag.4.2 TaxID=660470 RepID=I2F1K6_9BACT|nr:nitrilase-related carbon-nitrogen hydrolase [Mesotoga prima]AFK05809.1 putative amidohydrolase [Mesotoga prima MesG1.Ag.4.2]
MKDTDFTAIQVWFDQDSFGEEAFRRKMRDYVAEASLLWKGTNHIVVFPEFFATFLYPSFRKLSFEETTAKTLVKYAIKNMGLSFNPFKKAFLRDALVIEAYYHDVFEGIAKEFGTYLLAPSILLPVIDTESEKGRFIRGDKLYNLAYFYNPSGKVVARAFKHNLTKAESSIIFSRGQQELNVVHTEIGVIGIAICYDMFFQSEIEKLDAAGCETVLVPSCNFALWKGRLSDSTQERIWFRDGPIKATSGREKIRYLVNPMATGIVGRDRAQGRSSIWYGGRALAVAREFDREEILNVTI